jgi:hypothetical protein
MLGESGYVRKKLDSYWTQPWITQWLMAELCANEWVYGTPVNGTVWEPACGQGHISKVLAAAGLDVLSTDIFDHGWGGMHGIQNFLDVEEVDPAIRVVFTNPPYDTSQDEGFPAVTAEAFVRHALKLMKPVKGAVIMLLRNEFDCASGRADLFSDPPYAAKLVLTRRPTWTDPSMPVNIDPKTGAPKKNGPRHNYAWFFWDWTWDSAALTRVLTEKMHGLGQKT